MSFQRGNINRNRPQKYQNKVAFKNDLHDKTPQMKLINGLDIAGVCPRCKDIIEWKRTYKKYKPLTVPKKCTQCEEKTVLHAYHVACLNCAQKKGVCAKCLQPGNVIEPKLTPQEEAKEKNRYEQDLKLLSERQRRTLLRASAKESTMKENGVKDDSTLSDDNKEGFT